MTDKKPSQKQRLFDLLSDHQPHNTAEILARVYGAEHYGYANIHGRVTDICKDRYVVDSWMDEKRRTLCWYQLKGKVKPDWSSTEMGQLKICV